MKRWNNIVRSTAGILIVVRILKGWEKNTGERREIDKTDNGLGLMEGKMI